MKKIFMLVTLVWMLCILTSAWGGKIFTTNVQVHGVAAGDGAQVAVKVPTLNSRAVKLFGAMITDTSGTFDLDIYDNMALDQEGLLYTVDELTVTVNDDTPFFITADATTDENVNIIYMKITNNGSATRAYDMTLMTESLESESLTTG